MSTQAGADPGIRLQKVLATAGVGSRRVCEEMIEQGRVAVDGRTVQTQGMRIDPDSVTVTVDGLRVTTRADLVYLALNKPRGVVSTMSDDRGRPSLADIVAERNERLFHVGRLDADSEGLLFLTNDGELSNRLLHPSYGVPKTYLAEVPGPLTRGLGTRLRTGIELEDGMARVDAFRALTAMEGKVMVEVVLHEGRQHIVRRLLAAAGHPVSRLVRTSIGPVSLGNLRAGRSRHLTRPEVGALYQATGL